MRNKTKSPEKSLTAGGDTTIGENRKLSKIEQNFKPVALFIRDVPVLAKEKEEPSQIIDQQDLIEDAAIKDENPGDI